MKKWEYKILTAALIDIMIREAQVKPFGSVEAMNKLGEEGWEICAVWKDAIVLKREK